MHARNARATDPDFSRLTFALLGECDPLSLLDVPELSEDGSNHSLYPGFAAEYVARTRRFKPSDYEIASF